MATLSDWPVHKPSHTGSQQKVIDAITRAGEPLSVYKLTLATGLNAVQVRSAIGGMMSITGGLISLRTAKATVYDLLRNAPKKPHVGRAAGRITIPQFRWGATRLSW